MSLPTGATMDQKLDFIIFTLNEIKELAHSNQQPISVVENKVGALKQEMKFLKDTVNRHEQASRNLSIRILGLPYNPTENTARLAYDRILKPVLQAAKEAGKIGAVSQLSTAVIDAFRLSARSGSSPSDYPPQILVKISSSSVKLAIFSAKKALPSPSEAENLAEGILRFNITEELTPASYKMLKLLKADSRIHRAWSVDGLLKYTLVSDNDKLVCKVRSVFEHIDVLVKK